jgi:Polysaccharide biosynthesis protein
VWPSTPTPVTNRGLDPLRNSLLQTPPLVRNFFLLGAGEFAGKLCAFIAFVYLTRVLGPKEFGHIEFALALIVFFSLLVDCGLSPYGAREIAKDGSAVGRFTTHILFTRCMTRDIAAILDRAQKFSWLPPDNCTLLIGGRCRQRLEPRANRFRVGSRDFVKNPRPASCDQRGSD